jgi:hypothetical protein
MTTLSSQLTAAYRGFENQRRGLLRRYEKLSRDPDFDDFLSEVEQSFLDGVHEAYEVRIVSNLVDKSGGQQEAAEALGLRNRSSISQMIRSGSINGVRLTAALYAYPNQLLPSREEATLFGLARATSHVKAVASKDVTFERKLKAQQFSYLLGLLTHPEWERAIRDRDEERARFLAEQIVEESVIAFSMAARRERNRREGRVLMLQNLWVHWADFGIITLCSLRDRIRDLEEV